MQRQLFYTLLVQVRIRIRSSPENQIDEIICVNNTTGRWKSSSVASIPFFSWCALYWSFSVPGSILSHVHACSSRNRCNAPPYSRQPALPLDVRSIRSFPISRCASHSNRSTRLPVSACFLEIFKGLCRNWRNEGGISWKKEPQLCRKKSVFVIVRPFYGFFDVQCVRLFNRNHQRQANNSSQ